MGENKKRTYDHIEVYGNRVNNLKSINLSIPRGQLVVITGVSGSGKSSLAFDSLYAEGQRRYVESLSSYSRQFLERMPKPNCDDIKNLPPAVALQQRVISRNPRSLVVTSTDLYDYIKMLFARFGKTISPISGNEVKKDTPIDVFQYISNLEEQDKILLLSPLSIESSERRLLTLYQSLGFSRLFYENEIYRIDEFEDNIKLQSPLYLVIDRISIKKNSSEQRTRLIDSIEISFYEGKGICAVYSYERKEVKSFSSKFELDGLIFKEPSLENLDFNNPIGACDSCEGYGKIIGIDPNKVIPNENLSVYEGAVACWHGLKSEEWKKKFLLDATAYNFPIHKPYKNLTEEEKNLLWNGKIDGEGKNVYGIYSFFQLLEKEKHKIQNRVRISHFSGKTICPKCQGSRLKKDAQYVYIAGHTIIDVLEFSIEEARVFFENLVIKDYDEKATKRLLEEIRIRLAVLSDVGVGYLSLNRMSASLSGGESQRIALATRLGSNLYGAMYVLDEPSIGLHERDTEQLIKVLKKLRDVGNSIVVVEHDEKIMQAADFLVDIGPDAGAFGGEVVFSGSPQNITPQIKGYTSKYLTGVLSIPVPNQRRDWSHFIEIRNARKNNLKDLTLKVPLEVLTVITGVSGSGKSTLIHDILYKELLSYIKIDDGLKNSVLLRGNLENVSDVIYIDQNALSKNSRSNPVTYIGAYDYIRTLFSELALSKQMGYTASYFSFNRDLGRCVECQGDGLVTVEMQFMADLVLTCESCRGKRFRDEILDIKYYGKSIADILDLSVEEAIRFFEKNPTKKITEEIIRLLNVLKNVGLAYIKLGQNTASLSGGENQRLKLAYFFTKGAKPSTMFIFDEPTTGLHFHDIHLLMKSFNRLVNEGHSVVIIEHNMDVIKSADYIIDLGPEGGDDGGFLVGSGTPEELMDIKDSYTGKYLKERINKIQ